jgi:hypothetical protein
MILASPVIGSVLLDLCPPMARDPGTASTIARWHAHSSSPEILVLGSSRSGRAIDAIAATTRIRELTGKPDLQVFNAAVPAGDPLLMKRMSADLLHGGGAPAIVVIEVSPDTVGRRNRLLEFAIGNQFTARDILEHFGDIVAAAPQAVVALAKSRLMPFYEHRRQLRTWIANTFTAQPPPIATLEGLPWAEMARADLPPDKRAATINRNVRRIRQQLRDYAIAGHTPAALEHVVALWRARGTQVILLHPPLHSAHRTAYSEVVRQRYSSFITQLAAAHSCRIVDFSARLSDEMFRDSDHANTAGRAQISQLLSEEVLAPAWRELHSREPGAPRP